MDHWKYFSSFSGTGGISLFMTLLLLLIDGVVGGRNRFIGDLELKRHHSIRLNNLAIRTIQSEDGDIIDCVDIKKQPALNHPLLKNHSIQMRPSFHQKELESNVSSRPWPVKQIWQRSGSCPVGTIPIMRNTGEGLSKTFPIPLYGGEVARTNNGRQEGTAAFCSDEAPYYGARALLNVWSVHVEPNEFSIIYMDIINRDGSNIAQTGWGVFPTEFGDNRTRLYAFWTAADGIIKGCYNHKCPGFVQVSRKIALGSTINPLSSYAGVQYGIYTAIVKDDTQSSWWLTFNGELIGYWPVSIFSDLKEGTILEWGGAVYNSQREGYHTSTQLGSGHFAKEGFSRAAFICNMQAINSGREFVSPATLTAKATNPSCYSISWPTSQKDYSGDSFYFGGPGGTKCAWPEI